MKKNTQVLLLFLGVFLVANIGFAQVTNVQPTRITTKTTITIEGTGFHSGTSLALFPAVNNFFENKVIISPTLMTVDVKYLSTTFTDIHTLVVGGVDTGIALNYIGPITKDVQLSSPFRVTEVFTDWNGFYRSGGNSLRPNDRHDLLAFKVNGVIFSTGVDDAKLDANLLSTETYVSQTFKAYSTNGITGKPHAANYLAMADLIDGVPNAIVLNDLVRATVYDVIIDGKNGQGLDLGTGITNFNLDANIKFFSGNGLVGAVNDGKPDLLITQIAQPGGYDIYYYADPDGNVVGTPIKVSYSTNTNTVLYDWYLNLYNMNTSLNYDLAYPNGTSTFPNNTDRPFRMVAFELDEFGINASNIGEINNINMQAGGSADISFMAYNKAAFNIKSPIVEQFPVSRNVCRIPSATGITFNTSADVENGYSDPIDSLETLNYKWYKDFLPIDDPMLATDTPTLILPSIDSVNDLGTYKVRISNFYGSIDLPVTLSEGGTPVEWDGVDWKFPPALDAAGIFVGPPDRNLIFNDDYNVNTDLEGCDCIVLAENDVIIPSGYTLKLYSDITVQGPQEIYDIGGNPTDSYTDPGTFTLEDGASLIQTKTVTSNENIGDINVKRIATDLSTYDYVYWSSPVANYNISGIPGSANHTYEWDVDYPNTNLTFGNWVPPSTSGAMTAGKGYIKRVPSSTPSIEPNFKGIPNNGPYSIDVFKTPGANPSNLDNNWNLVGNPYPSAINVNKFLGVVNPDVEIYDPLEEEPNPNLADGVYVWMHDRDINRTDLDPFYGDYVLNYGDQYLVANGTASVPSGFENIASGQGFFIRVREDAGANPKVNFTNSMRINDLGNAYGNDDFYRTTEPNTTTEEVEKELLWLSLVNEANTSSITLVGYVDGATNERDRLYDAVYNGEGMSLYSLLDDTKNVIQGRAFPFEDTDTVPLGIDIPENGVYRIGIDQIEGTVFVDQEQPIYVEDNYLNVIHDLRQSPYSFTGVVGTTNDRFVLRYTSSRLSVDAFETNNTFVYIKDQHMYLKSSENVKSITLYDLTGKLLNTYNLDNNTRAFDAPFRYPRGVYLTAIQLEDNSARITKKLIN